MVNNNKQLRLYDSDTSTQPHRTAFRIGYFVESQPWYINRTIEVPSVYWPDDDLLCPQIY